LADSLFIIKTERKAVKSYKKMPEFYRKDIYELGKVLKFNPVPAKQYDITKLGGYDSAYRIRFGGIRVSYQVFWDEKEIHIFEIKWRGGAYK
jgi:mRNA-degrading endonuclease RelE of RelBE toxin-antitoxin system